MTWRVVSDKSDNINHRALNDKTCDTTQSRQETGRDLVSPLSGGWGRMGSDVASAFVACFPKKAEDGAQVLGPYSMPVHRAL